MKTILIIVILLVVVYYIIKYAIKKVQSGIIDELHDDGSITDDQYNELRNELNKK